MQWHHEHCTSDRNMHKRTGVSLCCCASKATFWLTFTLMLYLQILAVLIFCTSFLFHLECFSQTAEKISLLVSLAIFFQSPSCIQTTTETLHPESQSVFPSNAFTTDTIIRLRQIKKCYEQRFPLHTTFIDLTDAFVMVRRERLLNILQKISCPPTFLSLAWSLPDDMEACAQSASGPQPADIFEKKWL